jgi:hypothetical protein
LLLPSLYIFWPEVAPSVGWILLGAGLALTMLLMSTRSSLGKERRPSHRLITVFLACFTLALYLYTLGPTVGQADTFEFQVVAPTLGIAHPTGYPLYILSGKIFSLLPFGSVAWRVNLTSAIFGTTAVVLVFQLIYRLTGRSLVALAASLALAFSRVFWSQAVVAEVYALHNLFVTAVLLLILVDQGGGVWLARGRSSEEPLVRGLNAKARGVWWLYGLSLLLGLSLANHLTTVLLFPAVVVALLFVRPRPSWKEGLIAAGLFLLGLSLYAYIYVRWPALHNGVWMSLHEFWRYVTGQQFGDALRWRAWLTDATRYQVVGRLLRESFGWPGLILGVVGLLSLAFRGWRAALLTVLVFLAYIWYIMCRMCQYFCCRHIWCWRCGWDLAWLPSWPCPRV